MRIHPTFTPKAAPVLPRAPAWVSRLGRPLTFSLFVLALTIGLGLVALLVPPAPPRMTLWAWERPEDLRFAGNSQDVAAVVGSIDLRGDRMRAHGRFAPILADPHANRTAVVHIQIDQRAPLLWTPELRARASAAALAYARHANARTVQIDFEVRRSQRQALLDVLKDVRAGLPRRTRLSMTALASWCDTEAWLDQAPVDEVVPMLFRMGEGGPALARRLAQGGDFANLRCRTAVGISTDTPLARVPAGRRVYVFNPRSWTPEALAGVRRSAASWRG